MRPIEYGTEDWRVGVAMMKEKWKQSLALEKLFKVVDVLKVWKGVLPMVGDTADTVAERNAGRAIFKLF